MIARQLEKFKDRIPILDRETLRDITAVVSFLYPILVSGFSALHLSLGGR